MERSLRRTWAEINLDHLTYNLEKIARRAGENVGLMGVIKADAYGHGAVRVARHLERIGASYLAVSSIEEAEELRLHDVSLPILILGSTPLNQAERILRLNVTQAVQSLEIGEKLNAAAAAAGERLKVHVKLDTGMSRLGFRCDERSFEQSKRDILQLLKLDHLDVEGIFTHFAVSDEDAPEHEAFTQMQYDRFAGMIGQVEQESGFRFPIHHCCNGGGICKYPQWAWDMVRCGIVLYGTGEMAARMGMKPVMTLKTTVSALADYPAGAYVGYGCTYRTDSERRIAVLPIGYADGLFRALSNGFEVLTPWGPAPIVGRICMDMCMIDVTAYPQLAVGDEVEVYGEHNLCEKAAEYCGTISYELLCAVSKRVPRLYFLNGEQVDYNLQLLG